MSHVLNHRKTLLVVLIFLFGGGATLAFERPMGERCTGGLPVANFDFSKFEYQKSGGTEWAPFDVWYWLMSPRNIVAEISTADSTQLVVDFSPVLLSEGRAVILFKDAVWKKKTTSTLELVKINTSQRWESIWSVQNGILKLGDLGEGKAVDCAGQTALEFTFTRDIGTAPLKGRKLLIYYGSSTYDPLK